MKNDMMDRYLLDSVTSLNGDCLIIAYKDCFTEEQKSRLADFVLNNFTDGVNCSSEEELSEYFNNNLDCDYLVGLFSGKDRNPKKLRIAYDCNSGFIFAPRFLQAYRISKILPFFDLYTKCLEEINKGNSISISLYTFDGEYVTVCSVQSLQHKVENHSSDNFLGIKSVNFSGDLCLDIKLLKSKDFDFNNRITALDYVLEEANIPEPETLYRDCNKEELLKYTNIANDIYTNVINTYDDIQRGVFVLDVVDYNALKSISKYNGNVDSNVIIGQEFTNKSFSTSELDKFMFVNCIFTSCMFCGDVNTRTYELYFINCTFNDMYLFDVYSPIVLANSKVHGNMLLNNCLIDEFNLVSTVIDKITAVDSIFQVKLYKFNGYKEFGDDFVSKNPIVDVFLCNNCIISTDLICFNFVCDTLYINKFMAFDTLIVQSDISRYFVKEDLTQHDFDIKQYGIICYLNDSISKDNTILSSLRFRNDYSLNISPGSFIFGIPGGNTITVNDAWSIISNYATNLLSIINHLDDFACKMNGDGHKIILIRSNNYDYDILSDTRDYLMKSPEFLNEIRLICKEFDIDADKAFGKDCYFFMNYYFSNDEIKQLKRISECSCKYKNLITIDFRDKSDDKDLNHYISLMLDWYISSISNEEKENNSPYELAYKYLGEVAFYSNYDGMIPLSLYDVLHSKLKYICSNMY